MKAIFFTKGGKTKGHKCRPITLTVLLFGMLVDSSNMENCPGWCNEIPRVYFTIVHSAKQSNYDR